MKTRLKLGVLYNGTLHHDVLVKILTVGGECQALEVINDFGLSDKENIKSCLSKCWLIWRIWRNKSSLMAFRARQ